MYETSNCFGPGSQIDKNPPCIDRTLNRLNDPECAFVKRYTQLHTGSLNPRTQVQGDLYAGIRNALRQRARVLAAVSLGVSLEEANSIESSHDPRLPTSPWLQCWRDEFRSQQVEARSPDLVRQYRAAFWDECDFDTRYNEAEISIHETSERAAQDARLMLDDLRGHSNDPDFIAACDVWANSPDSLKHRGDENSEEDRIGYNAGIIHFFEYRASKDKSRRFNEDEFPATVKGFIEFTNSVAVHLDAVTSSMSADENLSDSNAEMIARADVIVDSNGNNRTYILLKDGNVIIAFQNYGEKKPRITSVFSEVKTKYYDEIVHNSLNKKDRGQINKLGQHTWSIWRHPE